MSDNLTEEELSIALALLRCPESELYRGNEKITLQQIANLMGLTRERVRQIEIKALSKLRAKLAHDEEFSRLMHLLYNQK